MNTVITEMRIISQSKDGNRDDNGDDEGEDKDGDEHKNTKLNTVKAHTSSTTPYSDKRKDSKILPNHLFCFPKKSTISSGQSPRYYKH